MPANVGIHLNMDKDLLIPASAGMANSDTANFLYLNRMERKVPVVG